MYPNILRKRFKRLGFGLCPLLASYGFHEVTEGFQRLFGVFSTQNSTQLFLTEKETPTLILSKFYRLPVAANRLKIENKQRDSFLKFFTRFLGVLLKIRHEKTRIICQKVLFQRQIVGKNSTFASNCEAADEFFRMICAHCVLS